MTTNKQIPANKVLCLVLCLAFVATMNTASATPSATLTITPADVGRTIFYDAPQDFNIEINPQCDCEIELWASRSYVLGRELQGEKTIKVYEDNKLIKEHILTSVIVMDNINPIKLTKEHNYRIELTGRSSFYGTDLKIISAS